MTSLHFKIQIDDCTAELQLPATQTLEDLAYTIIDASASTWITPSVFMATSKIPITAKSDTPSLPT
ncbi:MAG: hypothetical protein ACK5LK_08445 [Chthoniobacterales bacterium]